VLALIGLRSDVRLVITGIADGIAEPVGDVRLGLVDLVFQQRKVPYRVAIEVGGWEVIKQYVAMGMGISIVTGICLNDEDKSRLAVRNMRRYFPQRSYGVVMRKGKYLSQQARAFIDLVKPGLFARGDYYESGHSER